MSTESNNNFHAVKNINVNNPAIQNDTIDKGLATYNILLGGTLAYWAEVAFFKGITGA